MNIPDKGKKYFKILQLLSHSINKIQFHGSYFFKIGSFNAVLFFDYEGGSDLKINI